MDNDKLNEILNKQEETLALVKKLWKAEKWRRIWTILRYVVYIGVLIGAFYFLTPYIDKLVGTVQALQGAQSSQDLQKILEQLKLPVGQ